MQPEDAGLSRGQRRRTEGLRREEVAALCHMSTDYYARLERGSGPNPSEQMMSAIAQGLHLSLDERDHVFLLAGHHPPARGSASDHISPGLLRILDRLDDTPAEIVSELGETLGQSPLGKALLGDASTRTGLARSSGYRWFTDPMAREVYAPEDRDRMTRAYTAGLRELVALRGPTSRAAAICDLLLRENDEFRRTWELGEVGVRPTELKHFVHPEVGRLELHCQTLVDPQQSHRLLVFTAVPGTESHERLRLLAVLGSQSIGR